MCLMAAEKRVQEVQKGNKEVAVIYAEQHFINFQAGEWLNITL